MCRCTVISIENEESGMNEKGYSMGPTRNLTDLLGKWTEKKFCQDKIKRESTCRAPAWALVGVKRHT